MSIKIEHEGAEIEVYTAEEVTARETAAQATARTAAEAEFTPVKTDLEKRLGDATTALGARASEFAQLRRLSDEDKAKLTVAERTIYENQVKLDDAEKARVAAAQDAQKVQVLAVIKSKSNGNADLEKKMTEMWDIVGVQATTPEQLESKAKMVLGALSVTEPDLVATVAGFTGSYAPPKPKKEGEATFADSAAGAGLAGELGLLTKPPEKK